MVVEGADVGFLAGRTVAVCRAANERFYLRQIRGHTHLRSSGDPGPPPPAHSQLVPPPTAHGLAFLLKDCPRATSILVRVLFKQIHPVS